MSNQRIAGETGAYPLFRKKPAVVEAVQYDPPHACEQVWRFLGWEWPSPQQPEGDFYLSTWHDNEECDGATPVYIDTLEGLMEAKPKDWIIKGVRGEFYPCKPDIFDATYEPVANGDYSASGGSDD